ncbi:hypothetical protein BJX63DRAFT_411978 [Aspergillus granulosus]|uniref:Uncharacterized protein n=1 Tax=Aspergillus granulosus TaxID=176169 RepID=A0ABR4GWV3_9EURO
MVSENGIKAETSQLPPLFPFVVYFTHPDTTPSSETADLAGLLGAIRESKIDCDFHFRLDVYFLPGAGEDDCKAHYLAERAARPDYEALIRRFETRVLLQKSGSGSSATAHHLADVSACDGQRDSGGSSNAQPSYQLLGLMDYLKSRGVGR